MIAQDIGFTRNRLKERRIHDYDRLKEFREEPSGKRGRVQFMKYLG